MGDRDKEFRERLLQTFRIEAEEHLKTVYASLSELEKMPPVEVQMEIVETVFRASHSLKGAARAVNINGIEAVCQAMEGVFGAWKQRGINQTPELYEALYRAADAIRSILGAFGSGGAGVEAQHISRIQKELDRLSSGKPEVIILSIDGPLEEEVEEHGDAAHSQPEPRTPSPAGKLPGKPIAPNAGEREPKGPVTPAQQPKKEPLAEGPRPQQAAPPPADKPVVKGRPFLSDTVRVSSSRLNSLLLQSEELLTMKLSSNTQLSDLMEIAAGVDSLRSAFTKAYLDLAPTKRKATGRRAGSDALPAESGQLHDFFGNAITGIRSLQDRLKALARASRSRNRTFDRMVDSLLDDMKNATMMPFSTLLEGFPILVRDIAQDERKEIDLHLHGEAIEVDRRILEEMKDPLIHLVRNSIDHGIERPQDRLRANKPRRGSVNVSVAHLNGNKIELKISDDGAGIDVTRVRQTAVKNGLISQSAADGLSEDEALNLIFLSGISTSPLITDISGRGLGLAIVREKAERLGGGVSVETRRGAGTSFRIVLPLTVATFRGILAGVSGQTVIIPTASVERTARVKNDAIKTVENRETVELGGRFYSFVRLEAILELPAVRRPRTASTHTAVLLLSESGRRIAFGADEVAAEQEVLVKTLGPQLQRVRNVSGAAILGNGRPVPILNVADAMRSAIRASAAGAARPAVKEEAPEHAASVLVVEDSITSRILLKNILESAGYHVKTAVDGVDALTLLKSEPFDLVVSDVEMPRMGGFDLTAKIRADKRLSGLPVVIVTALETKEDRERGIEVGANAYIVKSSFDQSNLLETIKRLL